MIVSKARTVNNSAAQYATRSDKGAPKVPDLDEFLAARDYSAAIALCEYKRKSNRKNVTNLEWLAYAHFHYGEHDKSLDLYRELLAMEDPDPSYHTYAAACLYYLAQYDEAEREALLGPASRLQTRLLFHIAHKLSDEQKLMAQHGRLTDAIDDQLSLAAIHFLRAHYQEATEIYKRLLLENREYLAINVLLALCYCKLDYYDVSLEFLQGYLGSFPDSAIAVNVKACNHFKLYNGKSAETELKALGGMPGGEAALDGVLIKHNLVVFRGGEGALQVLPAMGGVPPEAPLNLVVYHLKAGELREAYELVKGLQPSTPQEYIIKAIVHASLGQASPASLGSSPPGGLPAAEHLKLAQQYFQLVGSSASECDTIPGRQCMASCFFLLRQFDDVLVYLKSIRAYFEAEDDFNWNFGVAKAQVGEWKEAEEALLKVVSERYRAEYAYVSHLARCHVMAGRARAAWELYLRMETSDESFQLLQLIATDCYRTGAFYYSAKAFDVLERLDPNPEYWEGKRGACVGVFQLIVAGKEPRSSLRDVLQMLRATSSPQVEHVLRVMRKWAKDNAVGM